MLFVLLTVFIYQDLNLATEKSWEALASPWMTEAEARIFESLTASEREKFKGAFVVRRLQDPWKWQTTGLYLPQFFCPRPHGDIRDQILYALGQPSETEPMAKLPELPRMWKVGEHTFYFQPGEQSGKVKLARQSLPEWDTVLTGQIKNPEQLYDFRDVSFGRTRLIQDLKWVDAASVQTWATPEPNGSKLRVEIPIPAAFKQYIRNEKRKPVQHMEGVLLLRKDSRETFVELGRKDRLRHGSQQLNLLEADVISFETHVPPGAYEVEYLIYSGYLEQGLRIKAPLVTAPVEWPRISDPIISQNKQRASLLIPEDYVVHVGDYFYRPSKYEDNKDAFVLVQSNHEDTRLLLHDGSKLPKPLDLLEKKGNWHVFKLEPQSSPFRLTALGYHARGSHVAVSAFGPPVGATPGSLPRFDQNGKDNYFTWEQLKINTQSPLNLLFVNGRAVVGSKDGVFSWPSVDWGEKASIRVEYEADDSWRAAEYEIKRNQVFEEIRVKPRFIVAGTRRMDGSIEKAEIKVNLDGKPAEIIKQIPLSQYPKLWGLVVNDALLKSATWPLVRESLTVWLKEHAGDNDMFYVVHISHRPQLVQEPTVYKPLVQAALNALTPATRNENYFTVQYLVDALTHLPDHQSRPHQVLLMTNTLTDEVEQMQDLIPVLRETGLQIYNLQFPYDFQTQSEEKVAEIETDPLKEMAERERIDQQERMATRDNFQEERNVTTSLGSFKFGKKKARERAKEERIRKEAFKASFHEQLGALTAGMSHVSGPGETVISLTAFFEELSKWQEGLYHIELKDKQLNEDRLSLQAPAGYLANWTLVQWN